MKALTNLTKPIKLLMRTSKTAPDGSDKKVIEASHWEGGKNGSRDIHVVARCFTRLHVFTRSWTSYGSCVHVLYKLLSRNLEKLA